MLSLDITVHRFASPDGHSDYARRWTQWHTSGPSMHDITCLQHAAWFVSLRTQGGLTRVDDEWWSAVLELQSPEGYSIGQRPALIYGKPYDIPVYTTFKSNQLEAYTVGLRTVGAD